MFNLAIHLDFFYLVLYIGTIAYSFTGKILQYKKSKGIRIYLAYMSKSFTVNAINNLKQTGSLFRSSKFLAKKLTQSLNQNKELVVVELGAGDGSITKYILDKMNPESHLYSYEINEVFANKLRGAIQDERFTVLNNCVSHLTTDFKDKKIDYVISSLPLANISQEIKNKLLVDVKSILKPQGEFIQYQYSINDQKLLKNSFATLSTDFCLLNMPPAFIYTCKDF